MSESALITQAYRYDLRPTPGQEEFLTACAGASRFWFNQGLALVKERLEQREAVMLARPGRVGWRIVRNHAPEEEHMNLPELVSPAEWEAARERLLAKEKEATRARDALAAERRRLPMVEVTSDYVFEGPGGQARLPDLFEGRRQLIVYSFMFEPSVPGWPDAGCEGCSMVVDNMGHLAHLHARDTSLVLVSQAPPAKLEAYKQRMGWTVPWYSLAGNDFNDDLGIGSGFGLNVFLRDADRVYRTYSTSGRGVEALGSNWTFLDLTPLGRQEEWEDSPGGYPQTPPYAWWRRHDEYGALEESSGG